jgi:hypothetical protein
MNNYENYKLSNIQIKNSFLQGSKTMNNAFNIFQFILITLIFIGLLYLGSKLLFTKMKTLVKGKIVKKNCSIQDQNNKLYLCDIEVEYKIKDETYIYTNKKYQSSIDLKENDEIILYYNKSNPTLVTFKKPQKILGFIIIILAFIIEIISLINFIIINEFKGLQYINGFSNVYLTE